MLPVLRLVGQVVPQLGPPPLFNEAAAQRGEGEEREREIQRGEREERERGEREEREREENERPHLIIVIQASTRLAGCQCTPWSHITDRKCNQCESSFW